MPLKRALSCCCVLIAFGSFAIVFIAEDLNNSKGDDDTSNILNSILILITNFGIVCAFDIAYLINAELFPTILLATAYGCCNVLGRFITISSPVVAKLP
jgi:hypothetical protein